MKKIVSLVLAVLMLVSLGAAVSAGAPLSPSDVFSYLYGRPTSVYSLSDILGYYQLYGSDTAYYDDLITRWVANCPEKGCTGVAHYYVQNGQIKWYCEKCEKSGVADYGVPTREKDYSYAATCPTCKTGKYLEFLWSADVKGTMKDLFHCTKCDSYFYGDYGSAYHHYSYSETINCPEKVNGKKCGKTATLEKVYLVGDSLYGEYVCGAGHTTRYELDDDYYGYNRTYKISVVKSSYGDYAVKGGDSAVYGKTKTVVFYPKSGYVLTDVLVNGVSAAIRDNSVTFTVYGSTTVRPYYTKAADLKTYTITASSNGYGTISAIKNSKALSSASKVELKKADTVSFNFVPTAKNYKVADVKIDGKSVGAVSTYTFTNTTANHKLEVTFGWKSPYEDVEDVYLPAVEFVTESGLMGPFVVQGPKSYFSGAVAVTGDNVVSILAELSDTANILKNDADRRAWAVDNGVIAKDAELSKSCDVQTACEIVVSYLKALEKKNAVTFTKLDKNASVKDAAIKLNLATAKTYDGNRGLNRYDLAAICVLLSNLEYKG